MVLSKAANTESRLLKQKGKMLEKTEKKLRPRWKRTEGLARRRGLTNMKKAGKAAPDGIASTPQGGRGDEGGEGSWLEKNHPPKGSYAGGTFTQRHQEQFAKGKANVIK